MTTYSDLEALQQRLTWKLALLQDLQRQERARCHTQLDRQLAQQYADETPMMRSLYADAAHCELDQALDDAEACVALDLAACSRTRH